MHWPWTKEAYSEPTCDNRRNCGELNGIQDRVRNLAIAAQMERRVIRKAHLAIYKSEKQLESILFQIEEALTGKAQ